MEEHVYGAEAGPQAAPARLSELAVASFVLGVLSCGLSVLTGIPGVICGIMSLVRIGNSERPGVGLPLTGRGLAIIGMVLSSLTMLLVPLFVSLALPGLRIARDMTQRVSCTSNLGRLARGLLAHEASHGLVPTAITAADGTPLLSWRVAILPAIGESALYRRFHLHEPWDSPHNLTLVPLMPRVFACPAASLDAGKTNYLLLAGSHTAFESSRLHRGTAAKVPIIGIRSADLEQAPARTVMIVEVVPPGAVEWTKPQEANFSYQDAVHFETYPGRAAREKIVHGEVGFRVAYADGHVDRLVPQAR